MNNSATLGSVVDSLAGNHSGTLQDAVESLSPYPVVYVAMTTLTAFVLLGVVAFLFKYRQIVPLAIITILRSSGSVGRFTIILFLMIMISTISLIFDGTIPRLFANGGIHTILNPGEVTIPSEQDDPLNKPSTKR
jgi:hypothetical protein